MDGYWEEIAAKSSTNRQVAFLNSVLPTKGLILDLCCGTARHSIPLSKEGYRMVGLDLSANLLRIAREKAAEAHVDLPLVRGDMRYLPFKPHAFSAVASIDTSFGYLRSESEDQQSLAETTRVLAPDGLLLIDVFNREHLIRNRKRKQHRHLRNAFARFQRAAVPLIYGFLAPFFLRLFRWKAYPSFWMLQNRTLSADGGWLVDSWIIFDKKKKLIRRFCHSVRLYSSGRLEALLAEAGFMVVRVYGDYELQSFGEDSRRLIVIAQRKIT
jgi:ubiquinone/menaquinone biosynthesis C-methylase UbiE